MEELDLKSILNIIWLKKGYIFLITILFSIVGFVYSYFFVTPMYQASTTVVLVKADVTGSTTSVDQDTSITQTDITINQKLVSTYRELIKSKRILKPVTENLKMDMNEEQLKKSITVNSFKDTELIQITVKNENPKTATKIANEIVKVFGEEVKEIYKINNVSVVDVAETPTLPSNINHIRTTVIFLAIGLLLSVVTSLLMDIFDTTIKSREVIEEVLELPILATIPYYESEKGMGGKKI